MPYECIGDLCDMTPCGQVRDLPFNIMAFSRFAGPGGLHNWYVLYACICFILILCVRENGCFIIHGGRVAGVFRQC